MNPAFPLFLVLLLAACGRNPHPTPSWENNEPFQQWCRTVLQADSGLVEPDESRAFQRLLCNADTIYFAAEHCAALDTVPTVNGKYYRNGNQAGEPPRWVVCLPVFVGIEAVFAYEILKAGDRFRLNSWAYYQHGNYACCWHDSTHWLSRLGPHFLLQLCGTGSGYCSSDAHVLFFPLKNSGEEANFPVWRSANEFTTAQRLDGAFQLRGDTIVGDYRWAVDTLLEGGAEELVRKSVQSGRFQALFKIHPAERRLELLTRDSVIEYWFDGF